MAPPDPSPPNASPPDPSPPDISLPGLDGRPGFDEPWQAELLAIAQQLATNGVFTPAEWSAALGAELRHAAGHGAQGNQATYYAAALAALERLTTGKGALTAAAIDRRQDQWRRAYEATPHGEPVRLEAGIER